MSSSSEDARLPYLSTKVGSFDDFAISQYGNIKRLNGMASMSVLTMTNFKPLKMLHDIPSSFNVKVAPLKDIDNFFQHSDDQEAQLYHFIAEICELGDGIPGAGRLSLVVPCSKQVNISNIGDIMKRYREAIVATFENDNAKKFQKMDSNDMFSLCEAKDDIQIMITYFIEDNRIYIRYIIDSFWKPANDIFIRSLKRLHDQIKILRDNFNTAPETYVKFRNYLREVLLMKQAIHHEKIDDKYLFPSFNYVHEMSSLHRRCVASQLIFILQDIMIKREIDEPSSSSSSSSSLSPLLLTDFQAIQILPEHIVKQKIPELSEDFRKLLNLPATTTSSKYVQILNFPYHDVIFSTIRFCPDKNGDICLNLYKREVDFDYVDKGYIPIFFGDTGQNAFIMKTFVKDYGLFGFNTKSTRHDKYIHTEFLWSEWNTNNLLYEQKLNGLEFNVGKVQKEDLKKIIYYQPYFSKYYPPLSIRTISDSTDKKKVIFTMISDRFSQETAILHMDRIEILNIGFTIFSIQNLNMLNLDEIIQIQTISNRKGDRVKIQIPSAYFDQYTSTYTKDENIQMRSIMICNQKFYCFDHIVS